MGHVDKDDTYRPIEKRMYDIIYEDWLMSILCVYVPVGIYDAYRD